jgi:hypothetical protein
MSQLKLFMLLLGCKPEGRNTEQHDVFFGIADSLEGLIPAIKNFWPEAKEKIHIDAWRAVTKVGGYRIKVEGKNGGMNEDRVKLFFLNLGGYKPAEFEEYHYKLIVACKTKAEAIQKAKTTAFYKHTGFEGAVSHIDDRYGVDVDDVDEISDILPDELKQKYSLVLVPDDSSAEDEWHLGYLPLSKIANGY